MRLKTRNRNETLKVHRIYIEKVDDIYMFFKKRTNEKINIIKSKESFTDALQQVVSSGKDYFAVSDLFEQIFGETPMILYGEGYGYKIQKGGDYRSDVSFILFDVYQPTNDIWLKREAVEDIAKKFNIDVVPFIMRGTIEDAVRLVKSKPMSTIGKAKMEGVVGRPLVELKDRLGKRVIIKVKVNDFE